MPDWLPHIQALLCKMYRELGRSCEELGITPAAIIAQVRAAYELSGPPTFETLAQRNEFIANLDAIIDLISSSDSTLTPSEDADLRALISKVRADIGA